MKKPKRIPRNEIYRDYGDKHEKNPKNMIFPCEFEEDENEWN